MSQVFTVWFTGLPCSGKSTLARLLEARIRERGFPVIVLDGDEVRTWLTAGLGFSREDREENIRRIAHLAMFQNRAGVATITAAISPYRRARDGARQLIGRFVEVYTDCPLDVCEQRDVKGHYKKARRGEIQGFTGVSAPYEPPETAEVIVRTDRECPEDCVTRILERIEGLGYLPRGHVRREVMLRADLVSGIGPVGLDLFATLESRGSEPGQDGACLSAEEWALIERRLRAHGFLR